MAARGRDDPNGALTLRGWALEAEAAAGIAKALAPTAFVPEHLRVYENPQERNPALKVLDFDATVQQVAAVLLAGQELEFPPMASLRAFVIIRGTVALFAIAARALLQRHGHDIVVVESTSTRAIVRGRRAGTDQPQQSVWDLDRAKTAGLYPGHPDGNWRKQTKAMLVARATAEVARWIASDAMLALPLVAEEVEDAPNEIMEAAPDDASANGQPPAAKSTAKRKTAVRAALPAPASGTGEGPPPPVLPVPEEPAPPGPKATRPQLNKLHAGLTDIEVTGREEGLALVAAWAGRKVSSTANLTRDEIGVVLERLDKLRALRAAEPDEPPPEQHPPDDEPPADDGGPPDAEPD
jgi:hypothetical protein